MALPVEVRMYDRLFSVENPSDQKVEDIASLLNKDSEVIIENAYAEPFLINSKEEEHYQFVRKGYFTVDKDSNEQKLVFNQTVSLKDSWSKNK